MYSDDDLNAAVRAGVMSAEAAQGLRDFVSRNGTPVVDEEHFRLLTGFNDIFVSIAAVLILAALGWLGGTQSNTLGAALVAAASWGFAEYFTRRRRMALPSILLLQTFVLGVFVTAVSLLDISDIFQWEGKEIWFAGSAALAAVAAYAHWLRFKVPITVAAGTVAATGTVLFLLLAVVPGLRDWGLPLAFAGGLVVFAQALRWDASDRERITRRSDVAFWLHLSAAPLIVHPIFSALGLLDNGGASLTHAGIAVGIYLVLAIVALVVDRRALLISALIYVLYAMSALFKGAGAVSESFALTALVLGSALLLLSASWHRARALLVRQLPLSVQARLPVI